MATTNEKIHGIIHTAALSAGAVGAGLAQIPGSDAPIITGIQTQMIIAIGLVHGAELSKATAADILLTFAAQMGGRTLSQFLIGWIPGWGNTINAATATSITEAIGWMAHEYFQESSNRIAS